MIYCEFKYFQFKITMKKIKEDSKSVTSAKGSSKAKSNINKEIDKLISRIGQANDNIKQTESLLDVDLFLKQQKQKKVQYANNLNAEFEAQRKIREEKLYKKHNRANNPQEKSHISFKTLNIPSFEPFSILKFCTDQFPSNPWVKEGHHYKINDQNAQGLRQSQQKLFKNWRRVSHKADKYSGDNEDQHIVWKNIRKIVQDAAEFQLLPIVIQDHSLIPVDSQAENLLSSLCLMTKQVSDRIFAQNDSLFMAELHSPSRQLTVVTDHEVLVREFLHKDVNLGSHSHNPNVMWPTIVQKCYHKLRMNSGLDQLPNSLLQSIHEIYGLDAELIPITNQNYIKENIMQVLSLLIQDSKVGFLSFGKETKRAYEGRVYLLEKVTQSPSKMGKEMQARYKIKDPWKGMLLDSQNLNSFTILELLEIFNCIVVLSDYPKNWSALRLNSSYFSNGPVGMTNNDWTKNPQYLFTLTKTTSLRIFLRQSAPNFDDASQKASPVFGFLLFQNKEADNKIQCMKMEALITKAVSTSLNEASFSGELKKGHYILIPYSTQQSEKSYQFFTFDFYIQNQKHLEFGKARVYDWNYAAKNPRLETDKKIIQTLENKELFEKPRVEKLTIRPLTQTKSISLKHLENAQLTLYQKVSLSHFFMPGFIHKLLINQSVPVDLKLRRNQIQERRGDEIEREERAQNLSTLLGYDAINEEINQGKVRDLIQQSEGIFEFQYFGLGEQGLNSVLETICLSPQIVELDLRFNELNDAAIAFLCYYLEKGNRIELRKLNVAGNCFGAVGKRALEGLKLTYQKLNIIQKRSQVNWKSPSAQ